MKKLGKMENKQHQKILTLIVKFQNRFDRIEPKIAKIQQDASMIDTCLNLIEQRLGNIMVKRFISL